MSKVYNNPFTDGVTLSPNAWYMKLICWLYETTPSDYKNLCPLFWTVVSTIVFLPILLVVKGCCALSDTEIGKKIGNVVGILGKWFFLMCGYLAITLILVLILTTIITCDFHINWKIIGLILAWAVGFVAFCLLVVYFLEMHDRDEYDTLHETSLLVKLPYLTGKCIWKPFALFGYFIAAIYHKCCPFINWESK